ncbi:MAG TPA: short-chain dehydrogenase [Opitutae bacterium]|nr:short-chain dehydrogenase [Opitutae bacterium]
MPTPSEYLNRAAVIIITGGSSGIGCSIIKAIQTVGTNACICNLSRSKPEILLEKKGVHISTDLSDPQAVLSAAEQLRTLIADATSGEVILINNSGFGDYGVMPTLDRCKQLKMIDLNVRAMVDLTLQVLPQMLDRGGAVVNIASTSAFQPTPFLATYGATKSFVLNWTLALNEDLRGTRVRALAICPGPTRSNFFKAAGFETPPMNSGANATLDMTADEVAAYTLNALASGKALMVTGWKNKCIAFFGSKFPILWVTRIGGKLLRKLRLEQHRKGQQ